ncbi:thioredoxin domain-containing protein [Erythrobacter sp. QSSC1-22B]|uniref:DsbA family protein n=1 Tax=Erythrobacter sp. QSSC1-22B TaxID=1860125 RepID=UPI0009F5229A|nr:thioredoxin domain-containing protein [Erythrobacter sp. QSSC1-22B]
MTRWQLISLLALIMLGAVFSYLLKDTGTIGRSIVHSASANLILQDKESPQLTHGDGNLTVVIFTDYQCPSCKVADSALQRAIARDGDVRVIYKDWPIFGESSLKAAKVALAAHRQGVYFPVHRFLMKSAQVDDTALRTSVEIAGGNWEQVEADLLDHGTQIVRQLEANDRDAFSLGLQGTPGYLIGSLLVEGALTEREFTRAFKQARAEP